MTQREFELSLVDLLNGAKKDGIPPSGVIGVLQIFLWQEEEYLRHDSRAMIKKQVGAEVLAHGENHEKE
jgi:hypothetical protein